MRRGDYAYQNGLILGAHEECVARGADLYCFAGGVLTAPDDPAKTVYDLAGADDLDGVIMVPGTMGGAEGTPELERLLQRLGRRLCMVGWRYAGCPSVFVDNRSGMRELARHLLVDHGRRRIAFINGPSREGQERFDGYRQALTDVGLTVDEALVHCGDFGLGGGHDAVAKLFDRRELGVDAIVAANDWMALGAFQALEARGLSVPDDVALAGFDDIEQARFLTPPLSSIRQSPRQLGIEAARLLLTGGHLAGAPPQIRVEPTVQLRQSCGCFPRAATADVAFSAPSGSLEERLAESRRRLVQTLADTAPTLEGALQGDWAEQLIEALYSDLRGSSSEAFSQVLAGLIHDTARLGNITAWHYPLCQLRLEAASELAGFIGPWLRAETLFEWAHIAIGTEAEKVQARRRLEREEMLRSLEWIGVAVRTALDLPTLGASLAARLPKLGIPSCYVLSQPHPDAEARLIIAYERERGLSVPADEAPFRTGEIVPSQHAPPRRHTMIVQPLFFKQQTQGFCAMEVGPHDFSPYIHIPELVSTALKAAELSRATIEEGTRRERAEQARMAQELEIATRIQVGVLPKDRQVPGLQIAASMLPATEVGGDYFDILPLADGCWLGIGDVTGHGLRSGIIMLMIQSIVAATIRTRPNAAPSEVWAALNHVLCDNVRTRLEQDEHATLSLVRYQADGRLLHAGAHEDLIIYRRQTRRCELLPTEGVWVGVRTELPEGTTVDSECRLHPGDVLVLYTDGILEAMDDRREQFGIARLCAAIEAAAEGSVEDIRDRVLSDVGAWMATQADDITLLVARYSGGQE